MYWDKMANFHGTSKKVENIRKNLPKCPKNVEFVQKSAYRPGTLYCRFKFSWTTVSCMELILTQALSFDI